MLRFGVYMIGLLIVVAALWLLLVMTGALNVVPATLIAVLILAIVGLGIMAGARHIDTGPEEIKEVRQKTGGTEVRKSRIE